MNFSIYAQPSQPSVQITSFRVVCDPCTRQHTSRYTESRGAIRPTRQIISTMVIESNPQSQFRSPTMQSQSRNFTSPRTQNLRSASQARVQPQRQLFSGPRRPQPRPTIFSHDPDVLMEMDAEMPDMYFGAPEFEYPREYDPFSDIWGRGNNFGSLPRNAPLSAFRSFIQQQQRPTTTTQNYSMSPMDIFGGSNQVRRSTSGPVFMMGNQRITPQEYERLVQAFLQDDPNKYGPPPASKESIRRLKEFPFVAGKCKSSECSVCQEEYKKGDKCVELPCEHNYHKKCVLEWLNRHDSCPICRQPCDVKSKPKPKKSEGGTTTTAGRRITTATGRSTPSTTGRSTTTTARRSSYLS